MLQIFQQVLKQFQINLFHNRHLPQVYEEKLQGLQILVLLWVIQQMIIEVSVKQQMKQKSGSIIVLWINSNL